MSEWIRDTMPLVGQQVEALNHDGDVLTAVFHGDQWSLKINSTGWFPASLDAVRAWRPVVKFVGEAVDHPPHYNQVPGIECIDVVKHFDFVLGNVIKYAWRAGSKADKLEDLKKMLWYAAFAVREEEAKRENAD